MSTIVPAIRKVVPPEQAVRAHEAGKARHRAYQRRRGRKANTPRTPPPLAVEVERAYAHLRCVTLIDFHSRLIRDVRDGELWIRLKRPFKRPVDAAHLERIVKLGETLAAKKANTKETRER